MNLRRFKNGKILKNLSLSGHRNFAIASLSNLKFEEEEKSYVEHENESRELRLSVLGRYWIPKKIDTELSTKISKKHKVSTNLADIISSKCRHLEEAKDMLFPSLTSDFIYPRKNSSPEKLSKANKHLNLKDLNKGVSRVIQSIENNEKIIIFGDYDVDGASSSALFKNIFEELNKTVDIYIPDRVNGYGPSVKAFDWIKEQGYDLVITVDCGSTALKPLEHGRDINLDILVIDHHLTSEVLPPCHAMINPNRKFGGLAAVGVSYLFLHGLLMKLKEIKYFEKKKIKLPKIENQLDLVALGTHCDVMKLKGLNRKFVSLGIDLMNRSFVFNDDSEEEDTPVSSERNLGIEALRRITGRVDNIRAYELGFILGPRLNAAGRVGKAELSSILLSTKDKELATKIATELNENNIKRTLIQQKMLDEAMSEAKKQENDSVILLASKNYHPGVMGIVAGRIKEAFNKPTAVVSLSDDDVSKASCRSISGVDFGSAMMKAKEEKLITEGGGHEMAAGFSADPENLKAVKKYLNQEFDKVLKKSNEHLKKSYDLNLTISEATVDFIEEINLLEPFGNGNVTPRFAFNKVSIKKIRIFGKQNNHLEFIFDDFDPLEQDVKQSRNNILKGILWQGVNSKLGDMLQNISILDKVTIYGKLSINTFGQQSAQVMIEDAVLDTERN